MLFFFELTSVKKRKIMLIEIQQECAQRCIYAYTLMDAAHTLLHTSYTSNTQALRK